MSWTFIMPTSQSKMLREIATIQRVQTDHRAHSWDCQMDKCATSNLYDTGLPRARELVVSKHWIHCCNRLSPPWLLMICTSVFKMKTHHHAAKTGLEGIWLEWSFIVKNMPSRVKCGDIPRRPTFPARTLLNTQTPVFVSRRPLLYANSELQ